MMRVVLSVDYLGDLDDMLLARAHDARRRMRDAQSPTLRSVEYADAEEDYELALYKLGLRQGWDMDPPPTDARLSNDHRNALEAFLRARGFDIDG